MFPDLPRPSPDDDAGHGPDPGPDDATAALLRAVLRREAEAIRPSTDGLTRILAAARTAPVPSAPPVSSPPAAAAASWSSTTVAAHPRPLVLAGPGEDRPRPVVRWMPALSAAAAVMIVCAGLGLARLGMISAPALDAVVGGAAPAAAPAHPPAAEPLPVYLVERQNQRWALVREFTPTTLTEPGPRLAEAVRLAVTGVGTDSGHTSAWRAAGLPADAAGQITTRQAPDGLVIRLPAGLLGSAPSSPGAEPSARLALQQLVWTATATTHDATPVRIEGPAPGSLLFGSLALGRRVGRDGADPRAPVWVSSLVDGQHLAPGRAMIQGDAVMSGRGTVAWRLLGPDGAIVATGSAPLRREVGGTPRAGDRGLWEGSLQLPSAGRYEFQVSRSWSGGQGRITAAWAATDWIDSKTLLVS